MALQGSNDNGSLTNGTNAVTGASGHGGGVGSLAQPGPMASLLRGTVEASLGTGARSPGGGPTNFTELLHEQHFSFINGGRLVIDLHIEGGGPVATQEVVASVDSGSNPSPMNNQTMSGSSAGNNSGPGMGPNMNNQGMSGPAGNNSGPGTGSGPVGNDSSHGARCVCGRKRRAPESGGTSMNLNENVTHADEEEEACQCEVPVVQGNSSGAASSRRNRNTGENRNRSGRSRRRGTPQRLRPVAGNSSGESARFQPPVAARQGVVNVINSGDEVQINVQDLVAGQANLQRSSNSSTSQLAPAGGPGFSSSAGRSHVSPGYDGLFSNAQGGTLGQTSNGQNIILAQRSVPMPGLPADTNPQQGISSTENVSEYSAFTPTRLVEPVFYRHIGIPIGNVNQGLGGGQSMQLRSGVNRRDPRLNVEENIQQPNENVLPGVNSVAIESPGPTYQTVTDPLLPGIRISRAAVRRLLDFLRGHSPYVNGNEGVNEVDEQNEQLDDMRLDVDEMSYEDLLALGELIGDVKTGLSEEAILQGLKKRKFRTAKNKAPKKEPETCCICLDEYENRQELGQLDCGHNFHFDCIKQWLMEKNFCPICKRTALPETEEDA